MIANNVSAELDSLPNHESWAPKVELLSTSLLPVDYSQL